MFEGDVFTEHKTFHTADENTHDIPPGFGDLVFSERRQASVVGKNQTILFS